MYCLKKIFAAEILALIGGICTGLMLVLAAITVSSVENADAGGTLIGGLGLVVFAFVGLVIFIIALIFNMIGLNAASKDDPDGVGKQFKTTLFCIIGSLVMSVASGIIRTSLPIVSNGCSITSDLLNLFATYYTLYGVRDFAEKLGQSELAEKANKLVWAVCALYVFAIVMKSIPGFASNSLGTAISLVLSLLFIILTIVQYIVYLSVLSKAKKVFAES